MSSLMAKEKKLFLKMLVLVIVSFARGKILKYDVCWERSEDIFKALPLMYLIYRDCADGRSGLIIFEAFFCFMSL